MELIIANVLLVLIMLLFTIYIFNNVIKRINQSAKKWFLDKLQEYNYLVEAKEKRLDELNRLIDETERDYAIIQKINEQQDNIFDDSVEKVLDKMRKFKEVPAQTEVPRRPDIVYDISTPQYKETSFFKTYKQLKKSFKFDAVDTINNFLEEHKKGRNSKEFTVLTEFIAKFSESVLYDCSTLDASAQFEIIDSVLTSDERKYVDIEAYREGDKSSFTIRDVVEKANARLKEIDPTIYVYTANDEENFDHLDPRIKTCFYKNMSEGVIIHYKGKMYDYSI